MQSDTEQLERRLSAILAADVVGYSSLVESNEESTLKAVKALWQNVLEPTARREGGRIVKTMGDGALVEFASAVRAVTCALNVQEATAAGDAAFPDGISLILRIGLHIGDIVIDGDDILGDGVNLAARLESLASPGGVCISSAVWDQLTADLALKFRDNGEQSVKNISRPVRTFAYAKDAEGLGVANAKETVREGHKPKLAIGQFEALTQDDTSQVFARGCQQTAAAYLSSLTGLTLVSPNASPDYLANASFQVLGERYRCVLKLEEARDEKPVLSERLDGTIEDIFDAQDALASRIATSIRYAVNENEGSKVGGQTSAPSLEQNLSRAGTLMMGPDRDAWKEAGGLLDAYIAARPDEFMAMTMKACYLLRNSIYCLEAVEETDARQAKDLLIKARQLNERSDFLHLIRAEYLWGVEGDLDEAVRAVDRSLEVTPDYMLGINGRARFLIFAGRCDEALPLFDQVLSVMSQNRIIHRILACKAMCEFGKNDLEAALSTAQRSLDHAPEYVHSLAFAAAAAKALGKDEMVQGFGDGLLRVLPELTLEKVKRLGFADPETEDLFRSGLLAAGVPAA